MEGKERRRERGREGDAKRMAGGRMETEGRKTWEKWREKRKLQNQDIHEYQMASTSQRFSPRSPSQRLTHMMCCVGLSAFSETQLATACVALA